MPDMDPRLCMSPDATELRELKEQVHSIIWAADTPDMIVDSLEDALLQASVARCLSERDH